MANKLAVDYLNEWITHLIALLPATNDLVPGARTAAKSSSNRQQKRKRTPGHRRLVLVQPYRNQSLVLHVVKVKKREKDTRKNKIKIRAKKDTGPTIKVPNLEPKLQQQKRRNQQSRLPLILDWDTQSKTGSAHESDPRRNIKQPTLNSMCNPNELGPTRNGND
jgi:hypothetical protein